MNEHPLTLAVKARFKALQKTRVLAFGSSNTEHFQTGMHWFDIFEMGIRNTHGRIHHFINTGISGNTTANLLERFEDDAAFYKPHIVLITIGGNDCNPDKNISEEEFVKNLQVLYRRFANMGTAVFFQTYYSPDPDLIETVRLKNFYRYTDIVRNTASALNVGLIDHLARWELLRKAHPELYKPLMRDGFHLNSKGNMVVGIDICKFFDLKPDADEPEFWKNGLEISNLMDTLMSGK
ncbi:MAG: hypothetical protein A2017_08495 [Lentisphaerae bacterium GWF2_44_16]|nr:MAG: hypothetical protein A2017_08495 [Lentisphaerae bacterium GWF2_44_16]